MTVDERYMRRALELASHGIGNTSPNPMVGAVIVDAAGRIIGEGYHRRCGEGHAEVNAVASVRDRAALADSTMYVTLEPCSHYGKTPPCAQLIIDSGIPRVVVAADDPFREVAGRGIAMLRRAGVEVVTGVLALESRRLNARFMTAHECRRPFVVLKWAMSSDGFMDCRRSVDEPPARFSTRAGAVAVHRLRSLCDGILVGSGTVLADNPRLDVRLWSGKSPRPVIVDVRGRVGSGAAVMARDPIVIDRPQPLSDMLAGLYERGLTSLLVEGGADTLGRFIAEDLWDVARVETSPLPLGEAGSVRAPRLGRPPLRDCVLGGNRVAVYSNNPLVV